MSNPAPAASVSTVLPDRALVPWPFIAILLSALALVELLRITTGMTIAGPYHRDVVACLTVMAIGAALLAGGRYHQALGSALLYVAMYFAFVFVGVALTYFSTRANFPAIDKLALDADRFFGFDWAAVMSQVDKFPALVGALRSAYGTIWVQGIVIILFLCAYGYLSDINRFFFCFVFCFSLTMLISMLFPAVGVLETQGDVRFDNLHFFGGAGPIPAILALRDGSLTVIDWTRPQGLITFPSFHAVMAVLWPYAARRTPLFVPVLILDIALGLAAFTEGGHYLVDVLAAVALAGLSIGLAHWAGGAGWLPFAAPARRPVLQGQG